MGGIIDKYDNSLNNKESDVLAYRSKIEQSAINRHQKLSDLLSKSYSPYVPLIDTQYGSFNNKEFVPTISPKHQAILKSPTVAQEDEKGNKVDVDINYPGNPVGYQYHEDLAPSWVKEEYLKDGKKKGESFDDWRERKFGESNLYFDPQSEKFTYNPDGISSKDLTLSKDFINFYGVDKTHDDIATVFGKGLLTPITELPALGNTALRFLGFRNREEYLKEDINQKRFSKGWDIKEADMDWDNDKSKYIAGALGQGLGSVGLGLGTGLVTAGGRMLVMPLAERLLGKALLQNSIVKGVGKVLSPAGLTMAAQDANDIYRQGEYKNVDPAVNRLTFGAATLFTGWLENVLPNNLTDDIITKLGGANGKISRQKAFEAIENTFQKNLTDPVAINSLKNEIGEKGIDEALALNNFISNTFKKSATEILGNTNNLKTLSKLGVVSLDAFQEGLTEASQTLIQNMLMRGSNYLRGQDKYDVGTVDDLLTDIGGAFLIGGAVGGLVGVGHNLFVDRSKQDRSKENIISYIAKNGDAGINHLLDVQNKHLQMYEKRASEGNKEAIDILGSKDEEGNYTGRISQLAKFINTVGSYKKEIENSNLGLNKWGFEDDSVGYQTDLINAIYLKQHGEKTDVSEDVFRKIVNGDPDNIITKNRILDTNVNGATDIKSEGLYSVLRNKFISTKEKIDTLYANKNFDEAALQKNDNLLSQIYLNPFDSSKYSSVEEYSNIVNKELPILSSELLKNQKNISLSTLNTIDNFLNYVVASTQNSPIIIDGKENWLNLDEDSQSSIEDIKYTISKIKKDRQNNILFEDDFVFKKDRSNIKYKKDLSEFSLEALKNKDSIKDISNSLETVSDLLVAYSPEDLQRVLSANPHLENSIALYVTAKELSNRINTIKNINDPSFNIDEASTFLEALVKELKISRSIANTLSDTKYQDVFKEGFINSSQKEIYDSLFSKADDFINTTSTLFSNYKDDFGKTFSQEMNSYIYSELKSLRDLQSISGNDKIQQVLSEKTVGLINTFLSEFSESTIHLEVRERLKSLFELYSKIHKNLVQEQPYLESLVTNSSEDLFETIANSTNNIFKNQYFETYVFLSRLKAIDFKLELDKVYNIIDSNYDSDQTFNKIPSFNQILVILDTLSKIKYVLSDNAYDLKNSFLSDYKNTIALYGYAGSGKTFMSGIVSQILKDDNFDIQYSAISEVLLKNLGLEISPFGVPITFENIISDIKEDGGLNKKLFIIDESTLLSEVEISELQTALFERNSKFPKNPIKILFLGDYGQLYNSQYLNINQYTETFEETLEAHSNFRSDNTTIISFQDFYRDLINLQIYFRTLKKISLGENDYLTQVNSILTLFNKSLEIVTDYNLTELEDSITKTINSISTNLSNPTAVKSILKSFPHFNNLYSQLLNKFPYPLKQVSGKVGMSYNISLKQGIEFLSDKTGSDEEIIDKIKSMVEDEKIPKGEIYFIFHNKNPEVAFRESVALKEVLKEAGLEIGGVLTSFEAQGLQFPHVLIKVPIEGGFYFNAMLTLSSRAKNSVRIFNQNIDPNFISTVRYNNDGGVFSRKTLDVSEIEYRKDVFDEHLNFEDTSELEIPLDEIVVENPTSVEFTEVSEKDNEVFVSKRSDLHKRLLETKQLDIKPSRQNKSFSENNLFSKAVSLYSSNSRSQKYPKYRFVSKGSEISDETTMKLILNRFKVALDLLKAEEFDSDLFSKAVPYGETFFFEVYYDAPENLIGSIRNIFNTSEDDFSIENLKDPNTKQYAIFLLEQYIKLLENKNSKISINSESKFKPVGLDFKFLKGVDLKSYDFTTLEKLTSDLPKDYKISNFIVDDNFKEFPPVEFEDSYWEDIKKLNNGSVIVFLKDPNNIITPISYFEAGKLGEYGKFSKDTLDFYITDIKNQILKRDIKTSEGLQSVYDEIIFPNNSLFGKFFGEGFSKMYKELPKEYDWLVRDSSRNKIFEKQLFLLENLNFEKLEVFQKTISDNISNFVESFKLSENAFISTNNFFNNFVEARIKSFEERNSKRFESDEEAIFNYFSFLGSENKDVFEELKSELFSKSISEKLNFLKEIVKEDVSEDAKKLDVAKQLLKFIRNDIYLAKSFLTFTTLSNINTEQSHQLRLGIIGEQDERGYFHVKENYQYSHGLFSYEKFSKMKSNFESGKSDSKHYENIRNGNWDISNLLNMQYKVIRVNLNKSEGIKLSRIFGKVVSEDMVSTNLQGRRSKRNIMGGEGNINVNSVEKPNKC